MRSQADRPVPEALPVDGVAEALAAEADFHAEVIAVQRTSDESRSNEHLYLQNEMDGGGGPHCQGVDAMDPANAEMPSGEDRIHQRRLSRVPPRDLLICVRSSSSGSRPGCRNAVSQSVGSRVQTLQRQLEIKERYFTIGTTHYYPVPAYLSDVLWRVPILFY